MKLLPRNCALKHGYMVHFSLCMLYHGKNIHLIYVNPDIQGNTKMETKARKLACRELRRQVALGPSTH